MSDDIELSATVELTPEQAALLKNPRTLEHVVREVRAALAAAGLAEFDRYFLHGPRP